MSKRMKKMRARILANMELMANPAWGVKALSLRSSSEIKLYEKTIIKMHNDDEISTSKAAELLGCGIFDVRLLGAGMHSQLKYATKEEDQIEIIKQIMEEDKEVLHKLAQAGEYKKAVDFIKDISEMGNARHVSTGYVVPPDTNFTEQCIADMQQEFKQLTPKSARKLIRARAKLDNSNADELKRLNAVNFLYEPIEKLCNLQYKLTKLNIEDHYGEYLEQFDELNDGILEALDDLGDRLYEFNKERGVK